MALCWLGGRVPRRCSPPSWLASPPSSHTVPAQPSPDCPCLFLLTLSIAALSATTGINPAETTSLSLGKSFRDKPGVGLIPRPGVEGNALSHIPFVKPLLNCHYFDLASCSHRIVEWFGLEGTFEDHLVQPASLFPGLHFMLCFLLGRSFRMFISSSITLLFPCEKVWTI